MITVDTNDNEWQDLLLDNIKKNVRDSKPVEPIHIAANLSVGQAWSHFTGYTRNVLPNLEVCIKSSKFYQDNPGRFPVKEFNIIPLSAVPAPSLNNFNENIEYEGDLSTIKADRGSFKGRPYRLSVYSILDNETNQKYFFVGQIPNTLSIFNKLETRKTGMSDKLVVTKGERRLQVKRFYHTYNQLVNHPRNEPCNDMIRFICYDDERKDDLYLNLLMAIKEECHLPNDKKTKVHRPCDDQAVCVLHEPDSVRDSETAMEIKEFLQNNNIPLVDSGRCGTSEIGGCCEDIKNSKWLVIVLSEESLRMSKCRLLMFKIRLFLHDRVMKHETSIISILDNVVEENLPLDLFPVVCIKKSEHRYKENLLEVLNCKNIHMEASVSSREVHQGLAWAYVLNYLEVTLKDLTERLEEMKKRTGGRQIYKKLFIIVPSSCTSKTLGALDKDINGRLIDPTFYQLTEIQYKTVAVGGIKNRDYQLIPYVLKTGDREVVVAVEYPNAVLCLQEMSELHPLSGLSNTELHHEAWKFKELAQNIIDNTPSVSNKAKLIYYDDSRLSVATAMKQVLQDEQGHMFL
ncbi:hypothetical protein ACF0H5_020922 [Mactra antiquata]